MTEHQTNRRTSPVLFIELALLGVLATLWGASYLFLKVAVAEIPPVTLIAARVVLAAVFLTSLVAIRRDAFPRGAALWGRLLWQAVLNSIAAWTLLAWGQQFVDAGLSAVLNSTSPIFVFLLGFALGRQEGKWQVSGACLGLIGVVLIVGVEALQGLGESLAGQLAVLASAVLYAGAALHGRHFAALPPAVTAAGTMLWASFVLVPASLVMDAPWTLRPSIEATGAVLALGIGSTGLALLIYFRLVRTLGALGVASQAYLRAGIGVLLGVLILGESLTPMVWVGVGTALAGVALINLAPRRR